MAAILTEAAMCCSCGCVQAGTGEPDDDHGDDRNFTLTELQAAADAAGITPQQAAENITASLAVTAKTGAAMIRTAPSAELIRKRAPSVVLKVDADGPGVVEALVSTTAAVDSQNDVIEPGAYAKFIAAVKAGTADPPAVCKEHEWGTITGTTLDLEEWMPGDPRLPEEHRQNGWGALWVRYSYILDSTAGADAYAVKKARPFGQHSVGFLIDEYSEAEGKPFEWKGAVRHIKRIYPLAEHSDVLMGAAPRTMGLRVKSGEVDDPNQRKARSAERMAEANQLVAAFKADWSTAYQNDLPDDAFAYIEPGGKKDGDGKTGVPDSAKESALKHVEAHAKKLGIEVSDDGKSYRVAGGEWVALKASTHSHYHFHPDGEAHSHSHAHSGDVADHDGPATKVPHAHGHEEAAEDGKSVRLAELKDGDIPGLPALPDDEAMHYGPLLQALDGIKALIAQECSEPGYGEFGDIIALACVGQDLLRWVRGEASEYGAMGSYSVWNLFDAGREALEAKTHVEAPGPAPDPPADLRVSFLGLSDEEIRAELHAAATEAANSSTQLNVPDHSGEPDGLSFERRRARPHPLRFGG